MRLAWAIVAGIALGGGLAWWMSRESPEQTSEKQRRAERAAAAQARDAVPALYRWRDENGVLQITDQPPKGRRYERIDRNRPLQQEVRGD
ncbi:hypothetical protein GCM10027084_02980 [Pseudoxanthomonas sangjuensis]|uniref:DUF4124 domain-containing protein n=1 Tax=Pseudoxanthomonas sangjuensis TaxID=1503750 RepID=UPI001391084D|nr:DUF4124 domain-containing protein [Pseudoxanthomonas sangjuensis]KAF1708286.1 hypothetical protein CSC71_11875 [Pseudoxanthomonas sangjuensis]